jgi:hypothetical protein
MWKLFDPRHMNVIDLWRVVGFCILLFVLLLLFLAEVRRQCRPLPAIAAKSCGFVGVILSAGAAIILGDWWSVRPEVHAPGRLISLLVSSIVLGYNAFAFRLPGIVAVTLAQWILWRFVRKRAPEQPIWWHATVISSIAFIPTVFYSSEAVEPSISGFCTYVGVMLFCHQHLATKRLDYLVLAAVIAAVGTLCRQSTVITWVLIALTFLCQRQNWRLRSLLVVFTPFLIDIPYLYSVSHMEHPVLQSNSMGKLELLSQAISSGIAIMSAANSTTLPWVVITLLAVLTWLPRAQWKEAAPFALLVPALFVFLTIWPYLWGLGRYQAEYIAPFVTFAIIFSCVSLGRSLMKYACTILAMGIVSTLELNSNLSLDINYAQWPRMRVTSSASFPYREALGTLKRAEVGGNFAIIGGSPIYNKSVLWLSGFSFWESARWEESQNSLLSFLSRPRKPADVRAFVLAHGIQSIVVQSGTRREKQHRESIPGVSELVASLEKVPLDSKNYFHKQASFGGEHGGILTIYRPRE